jgi:hypothetical protein
VLGATRLGWGSEGRAARREEAARGRARGKGEEKERKGKERKERK